MEKKINRFIKIYPWYYGLVGDLLFYIAIDSLFLTIVKNFTAAQFVSLTTVSTFSCILLQFPILWVIKKIGNTASVRVGTIFLLLSAVFITLGPNYYYIALGRIFHEIAAIFQNASFVALENNLDLVNKREQFTPIRTKGNTVYAVITMLISFVASLMFNFNHYLPMVGCIVTCFIGFILSFYIKDYSSYNKIDYKNKKEKVKIKYSGFIIMAICVYGLFYPIVTSGQTEGKLFIQQNLMSGFYNVDTTSLIIGVILCVSRIVRVASNVVFVYAYKRYRSKIGIVLTSLLSTSIALMLFGSFITPIIFRIIVMSVGYIIILFIRDPFRLFLQDVLIDHTPKEMHQTLLTMMVFAVKVGTAGMSFIFSMMLLKVSMHYVMALMLLIGLIEVMLSVRLYGLIMKAKMTAE